MGELLSFLHADFPANHPFHNVKAIPDDVAPPEIWLLGSSDFSAELSAQNGLRFAFAHHIQPEPAISALRLYRETFRPSEYLEEPEALIAVSVVCADTDERAEELSRSHALTMLRFRSGRMGDGRFPSVAEATDYPYTPEDRLIMEVNRPRMFAGSPARVREHVMNLADEGGVNEIMVTTMIHDHRERRHSYELLAEAFALKPGN
jgi:luciferase family oxidoreductase group 1